MSNEHELNTLVPARGWVVKYEDGTVQTEWDFRKNFSQLPELHNIVGMALVHDGKIWTIKGKRAYFAGKSWSAYLSFNASLPPTLETRYIGYWEEGKQITYKVDERTGKMAITVKDANE